MDEVTLIIDDTVVKADKGTTILEAARAAGIDIPTLCSHEKLAPYGACRLCTVEIVKGQRSQLVASCVYPVEEGLVVNTASKPVVKGRKMLLELLWARAPGIQALRQYGVEYGISAVRAGTDHGVIPGISSTRTKFGIEPTFCILCGLCVRYCHEIKKKDAIGFVGRGTQREVVFLPELAANGCRQCEDCYPLCPTGTLPLYYTLAEAQRSS
jgi:bidirectional [NiFe] hydrogenase diaphorase subunit